MTSQDESFSTSTELALMFGNLFGVAEADNLSIDTDSSGTATDNFDQTPQANIVSGRQTSLELTDNRTQQTKSTTTPNLLAAQTQTSTINVNYNGFSTQAQAAFEYAVDIWESLIVSPVPIEVEANWTPIEQPENALGSARSNDYYYNFDNAAYANTLYPSALANSLAGVDLDTTAHDIDVNFNSNYSNWYFGTDGNTPTGKTDLVSVVLHELGHGLGFSGSMDYDFGTGQGSWWSQPKIYDHFTVNGSGQKLINTFPNNSVALGDQLINNNLFFNGSNAVAANGGTNPKLYAPSTWELGSSYAHLDGATYGSGSSNALMTPSIAPGEAHHDPGAVTLGIFEDLGWIINFQPQADLWGWDFNVNPEPLNAGDSFNIDFEIANTGGMASAFDVSFYLSSNDLITTVDYFLGSTTITGLAGNSTGSFTTSLNLPSVNHSFWNLYGDDTYYIGMKVDSDSDVTESDETNNSNVGFLYDYDDVVINNTQLADLWGWDFNVNPEPLDAGDSFDVDFDITNTGSSAGAFDVSFYLSSDNTISTTDHWLGTATINGLAGNSTGSFTTSLNLPSVNHSFWNLYGDDTYYIGMKVDSGSDVTESNETNNSNVGFLFDYDDVAINNTQLADLSGVYFDVTPEPLNAGDSFDIDFDISNTGSSAGAFDVSFYLSSNNTISTTDHWLGTATINSLAGNSTGSFTTSLNLPGVNHSFWNLYGDDTYYIGMRVDSGSDVTEVNETNNSNVGFLFDYDDVVINNTQMADLSGVYFDVMSEPLDAGDSFDIDFDISNTGSSAGAFDVSFYLSSNNTISTMDHLLGSTTINGLAGNSTGSFTTSLNLPSVNHSFWNLYGDDTYYIGMRVDSGADVTEVNETNNSNVGFLFDYDDVVINNTQMADLSGVYFDVISEPLDAGDSFDIDFDITNTGSSAGAFDVSFYLSSNNTISTMDHLLGSTTINGLAGNSTGSFTTSLNLPSVNHSFWNLYGDDTYYIGMMVDSGSDVTESNETNNSNVGFLFDYDDVAINNTQLADLSGVYFDVISEPLDAGDSFDIDFDISNTGSSAGAFDVSFYLSSNNTISTTDHWLGSATINGLAGNSTGSFTTSLNLPGVNHSFWNLYGDDTYYIGMRVDSGSDVTESNETNNSNVGFLFDYDDVVINNTQMADLSGLYFDVTPEPLNAGDSFDIDFDISNTGSSAGAFDVSFYLSSNNTISTTDHWLGSATINGLAGNSTGSFTTSLNLPGVNHSFWNLYGDDTYYIGMKVDSGSDVTEVNETNNSNVGFLFDYDDVAINNTQMANLSGLNFNVTPEPLNAGDSFDIDLTIENSGAAAAGAFDVSLYLSSDSNISNSDLLLDTISFTGLAANSSGTFTSNFILPEANDAFWSGDGTYYIGMMVDSGDDITETIETDNANLGLMLDTDNVVIHNTQLADLVGVDFNLVQEPLAAGDHFDVNFEVQNTEMFAAGAFDVSFYVSTDNTIDTADQFLGSATINGLAGNSIGAYTTGLTLPGINDSTWNGDGIYYIGMIIDQDGTLPETDETNNANNGLFVDYDNVLISNTELIGTDDDDTLFGTPGNDILSGLRDDDDLVGGGGDDTLFGDRGDDNLFGEAGNDMLFGDRGDDYLFGGTGNDMLFGDRGDDLLIGVELNLANPGLGEVDNLIGGFGADVFQLGDVFSAYYDDADETTDGSTDYALITDFDINQDIIELHGSAADYQLATVSPSLPSGIGIFLQSSTPSGQDELIGIVQGESSLSLNDSYFSFV